MSSSPKPDEKAMKPRAEDADLDISVLEDSLAMTPLERMQANDDAVNFADGLRASMQERHAKSG